MGSGEVMFEKILQEWERLMAYMPTQAKQDETVRAGLAQEWASKHGNAEQWLAVGEHLQVPNDIRQDFTLPAVSAFGEADIEAIETLAAQLMPWRKGPFQLCGVDLDCEWRSDLKYARLQNAGFNVNNKTVLDVGTGSGYFLYRLLGDGAKIAVGIEPSWLYFAQFQFLQRFMRAENAIFLPSTLDTTPLTGFDTVMCMGVLYHRRDPLAFIAQLRDILATGGQLLIETLVVDGDAQTVYMPEERYAGMRNVWFLPSTEALSKWLTRLGLVVEYISEAVPTTNEEQRQTRWMLNHSFADFMKTHGTQPYPQRAFIIARKST